MPAAAKLAGCACGLLSALVVVSLAAPYSSRSRIVMCREGSIWLRYNAVERPAKAPPTITTSRCCFRFSNVKLDEDPSKDILALVADNDAAAHDVTDRLVDNKVDLVLRLMVPIHPGGCRLPWINRSEGLGTKRLSIKVVPMSKLKRRSWLDDAAMMMNDDGQPVRPFFFKITMGRTTDVISIWIFGLDSVVFIELRQRRCKFFMFSHQWASFIIEERSFALLECITFLCPL
jgi:hypothetical protein